MALETAIISKSKLEKVRRIIESIATDKLLDIRMIDNDDHNDSVEYGAELDNSFMEVEHIAAIYHELKQMKVYLTTVEACEDSIVLHFTISDDLMRARREWYGFE